MNAELNLHIPPGEAARFESEVAQDFIQVAQEVQGAMAFTFHNVVRDNFGDAGFDRPRPWPMLSLPYAKKVGRPHATLEVSGKLKNSVQEDNSSPDKASVFVTDATPYALVHQFGGGNAIPARPYFPVNFDGQVTLTTQEVVRKAAEQQLNISLKKIGG